MNQRYVTLVIIYLAGPEAKRAIFAAMQFTITVSNVAKYTWPRVRQSETKRSATGYAVVKANAGAAFIAVETVRNATGATVYSRPLRPTYNRLPE